MNNNIMNNIMRSVFVSLILLLGCDADPVGPSELESAHGPALEASRTAGNARSDKVELQVFMPAGDIAGIDHEDNPVPCSEENPCPLEPGTEYPPTRRSHSILHRGTEWLSYNIHTSGLPPGAYTNWWVIFNRPEQCFGGPSNCGIPDLFANPAVKGSVFWADGKVVRQNGVGNFRARINEGETPNRELILGEGLEIGRAGSAAVHVIVKYHGPASDDPDVLYEQTHTLLGSCDQGVNAFYDGTAVQCFDPQFAAHVPH